MSFEWYGEELVERINQKLDAGLLSAAADLQSKSIDRAPIDTGKLRENCIVDDSEISEHVVYVGYTREVDDYSMVQHERLDFNHPRGGGPKYLEGPLNENARRYITNIANRIKRVVNGFSKGHQTNTD